MTADDVGKVLILAAPAEWAITYLAYRASRELREASLTFMVGVLFACSVIVSVGAAMSLLSLTGHGVSREWAFVGIVSPFLIAAVIPPLWILGVAIGRFR